MKRGLNINREIHIKREIQPGSNSRDVWIVNGHFFLQLIGCVERELLY